MRAGKGDAADGVDDRDLGQFGRAVPAVDCQGQGAADARVVERLFLMVRGQHCAAVPVAGLDGDLVAERFLQFIDRGGRKAAELDRGAVAADRIDPGRLLVGEDPLERVEIGQPLMVVVGVAHPTDRLAGLILDELERA